jgi:hypothetical protein
VHDVNGFIILVIKLLAHRDEFNQTTFIVIITVQQGEGKCIALKVPREYPLVLLLEVG